MLTKEEVENKKEEYLALVYYMVSRETENVEFELKRSMYKEIVRDGITGLEKALKAFEPSMLSGNHSAFSTFAVEYINNEIKPTLQLIVEFQTLLDSYTSDRDILKYNVAAVFIENNMKEPMKDIFKKHLASFRK